MLNTSASCLSLPGWACMSLILLLIQRNGKRPLRCWRWWESSGEMWHLLAQLLRSMLGTCYELLPEQHSGLDAYLVYPIHHSQVLRSSGAVLTAIWETYSTPCFHRAIGTVSPPQETFPWLSPQHSQFSVLHCEGFREPEMWPLLPPRG